MLQLFVSNFEFISYSNLFGIFVLGEVTAPGIEMPGI